MRKLFSLFLVLFCLSGVNAQIVGFDHWETAIYDNDLWKYHIGNTAPPANWRNLDFNDSSWLLGQGGFGYGDGDDNTVIEPLLSIFIRKKFSVADSAKLVSAILHVDYDDGFVAYLNGKEVARVGLSGEFPAHDQEAESNHEAEMKDGGLPSEYVIDAERINNYIQNGENVLAVQGHNREIGSSDMTLRAFLTFAVSDTSVFYGETPEWFREPFVFTESNLPIVKIETENKQTILDEPKINAKMKIIHNGPQSRNHILDAGNVYDGDIGIEIRGAYSSGLPQKPFGLETRDSLGENLNVDLLGMPRENDWILLANYNDKVFMRNSLAFHLFRQMGHYAPRTEFCELMLNDSYEGIYVFTERIKRDRGRVAVARLDPDDNAGDSLTGGYIFKVDYFSNSDSWESNFSPTTNPGSTVRFVYHDPEPDEISVQQKNYISNFVNAFETALYSDHYNDPPIGYRSFIDVNSFVDYFIIGELSRNVDAYKKSRYLHKHRDRDGGLLHSGPVWDFDWAWKDLNDGCDYFNYTDGSNWAYRINDCSPRPMPPGWIIRLMEDTAFVDQVYTRYFELRQTILSAEYLNNYIDSVHTLIDEAQQRHYTRWPILGRNVGAPEVVPQPDTYEGEIKKFKDWIALRISWLDANMPGKLTVTEEPVNIAFATKTNQPVLRMFPNPAREIAYVESDSEIRQLQIYNLSGMLVGQFQANGKYTLKINLKNYRPGLYLAKIMLENGKVLTAKLEVR